MSSIPSPPSVTVGVLSAVNDPSIVIVITAPLIETDETVTVGFVIVKSAI